MSESITATAPESSRPRACLLIYDIPDRSGVPNPSVRLRRVAVRVNLSCWVVPEGDVPYALLNRMQEGGASWHVVRFDANEGDKLAVMAVEAIRRDVRDALVRARRSERVAEAMLEAADPATDAARDAQRVYADRQRAIVRRLVRLLQDFRSAAGRFRLDAESLTLGDASAAVDAIQAAMRNRARLYAEAITAARELAGENNALANAADADLVPAGVLADYIEDRGADANALRSAFSE